MPEQNKSIDQEREIDAASGEVIQFHSSTDAVQYNQTVDHLRILKGTNTVVQDTQYDTNEQHQAAPEIEETILPRSEHQDVSNLEGLPLPQFVARLRKKRTRQLKNKPSKAA